MAKKYLCKITVMERKVYPELQAEYLGDPELGKCDFFHDGQEFLLEREDYYRMKNTGFCSEAWDCLSKYAYVALHGGSFYWTKDQKTVLMCCNDATRPVVFKLEQIVEETEEQP